MTRTSVSLAVLALLLLPAGASAQSADNVLVVINEASQASVQIGEYYARVRSIAPLHVIRVNAPTTDTIQRADYARAIEGPIVERLMRHNLHDRILYIVLTKGVPLRIAGSEGRDGTIASVDSDLTLLYQRLAGQSPPLFGRIPNPYYLGDAAVATAKPFTRFVSDIYLVTRLDGYTVEDALKLVDRSLSASTDGIFVLDQKSSVIEPGGGGDRWLQEAADRIRLATSPARIMLEASRALAAAPQGKVLGYFSWGSNDPANRLRTTGMDFAPGAIGGLYVSTDGRTFTEPPADWIPGPSDKPLGLFGNGSQSMIGDLIREGLTGVSAHVAEPFLDAVVRPHVLFPAYLAGFNLAEAYYLAMPYLSWQTIVIGDPLCAPFPRRTLPAEEISKGIDPDTDLPALLSERRLAVMQRFGYKIEAVKLVLKADGAIARGDDDSVTPLLLKATDLEPRYTSAQLHLAERFAKDGDHKKVVDRYQRVIALEPNHAAALNNLAYAMAVNLKQPAEALPFAERAYRIAPSPIIADTLAWIHYLLGDARTAAPLIEQAVAALKTHVDVLVHAAVIHGALNDLTRAKVELDAAEKIDPGINERPEVIALRAKLKT